MKPILLGLCFAAVVLPQSSAPTAAQTEFFENRIRPLFAQQCFACHTSSQMGGLRLDSRQGLLKGGRSGPVVIPGDPDNSVLIAAVKQTGDLKMPKNGRLSAAQVQDLATWIKDGAAWPDAAAAQTQGYTIRPDQRAFWSFQPLQKTVAPKVKDAAWPANDIDRFVLAKLEHEGMQPTAPADRRTLIRRVSYDLTGLPPTFEEVKAFENDKSPNAYEKLVDRLLASPHYGEMWARHWLDVVRFGESDYRVGEKKNHEEKYPFAYVYRDWMIDAMNSDMPYSTMVKAQLAGDLMDEKVRDKMIPGLGMHGMAVWQFNDNPPAIERAEEWNDKVDVTTKTFLGMTVGCARCHDHKYDPIPQKDYYRLVGVFASSSYHGYPLVPKEVSDEYEAKKKELSEKEKVLKDFQDQLTELTAEVLFSQTEKYMVASWKLDTQKKMAVEDMAAQEKLDPEILARWVHFLKKKPVNYSYLVSWQKMVTSGGSLDDAQTLAHDFYLKAIDVDKQHTKMKDENQKEQAKFKDGKEAFDPMPNGLKRNLKANHQVDLKSMDREVVYLYRDLFETDLEDAPINANAESNLGPGLFKVTDWALQRRLSPEFSAHIDRLTADIEAFKKAMPKEYPLAPGLIDNKEPANVNVFLRGDPYSFGEEAPRAFLTIFSDGEPKPFAQGSGRMELAEDILQQPIAMRTIVNRIWRWNMGTGLVETPNNLGFAGDRPSNPELLDYLAGKFVADGMSWKKLTKEIVMSRTYQLSSTPVEENIAKDADDRFYWRANRRRLDSEGIWDGLLSASAKLDLSKLGGPSEELDPKMTRRGLYGRTSRVFPTDFQTLFDSPTPTLSAEKRYTTNVALQRLFFLNNEFVHKQAAGMADRLSDAAGDEAKARKAFEIVYQRDPSAEESAASLELLRGSGIAAVPEARAVNVVAKPAPEPTPEPMDAEAPAKAGRGKKGESPVEALCWALLSSNEFLFLQ
jgi:mono/diheme cytochrome c family protein